MQAAAAAGPGEETMGVSTSWGLLSRIPAPHREPQEAPSLNQLPIEMLRKVLSYLPPSTLLRHCRPVCRRWRDVVDGWDLWRSILPWKHPDLWPVISTCLPPADNPGPCMHLSLSLSVSVSLSPLSDSPLPALPSSLEGL